MARFALAVLLTALLSSCSVSKLLETSEKVGEAGRRIGELSEKVAKVADDVRGVTSVVPEIRTKVEAQIAAADKDGDGRISWQELLISLGLAGGAGGTWIARRNGKSDARKADTEARLALLESRQS